MFRHVEALVAYLIDANVEVDLAYSSRRSSDDLFELVRQVEEAGGRTVDLLVGNAPSPVDLGAYRSLAALVTERRPDVVHAHSSKAGGLVRMFARLHPGPVYLYTPHAYYGLDGRRDPRTRMFTMIERWLGPVCDSIHVSRDENTFGVERLGLDPAHTHVLEHGIDTEHFQPADEASRTAARKGFGLNPAVPVVGFLGRLDRQKDLPTLYRALRRLRAQRADTWLLQVGKGPDRTDLSEFADALGLTTHIRRVDEIGDPLPFYQAVDQIAVPSLYEAGVPYVALEALACGLPLVGTRCPGLRTIDGYGFDDVRLVEVGDDVSLGDLLLQNIERGHAPNNHRQRILERFRREDALQHVLDLYRSLLDARRSAELRPAQNEAGSPTAPRGRRRWDSALLTRKTKR